MSENLEHPQSLNGEAELQPGELEGFESEQKSDPWGEAALELAASPEVKISVAALLTALGEAVNRKANPVELQLKEKESILKANGHQAELQHHEAIYTRALVFGAVIFGGLCVMVWNGKLSSELGGTLIGALIGYWFGHQGKRD